MTPEERAAAINCPHLNGETYCLACLADALRSAMADARRAAFEEAVEIIAHTSPTEVEDAPSPVAAAHRYATMVVEKIRRRGARRDEVEGTTT